MKLKTLAILTALGMVAQVGSAIDNSQVNTFKKALVGVEVLEVPAKAASLVSQADAKDKEAT